MEHLLGLLRVRVVRGVNIAYRDTRGSDPYVVLRLGHQKLKTSVKKKNNNPEWNEELTLSVSDPTQTIRLHCMEMLLNMASCNFGPNAGIEVFDKDTFSGDDRMGDAEFEIQPFFEAVKMDLTGLPNGTIVTTVKPERNNCLSGESVILWKDGRVTQDLVLRLRNVESGEVELQLQWVSIPGAAGQ
ncbi:GTPase activating protein 1-like isoform X1 [Phoenix dactylifera]|uniref:GTPase activating protein 1-like isoform X1 n=1 Tax=Phoenix dactylifera TaxID=42345 RepID=A0A8B8JA59_PHODC|nr:GTPase activating protein 1-like isoform X1 [Phoenix dactylifera]